MKPLALALAGLLTAGAAGAGAYRTGPPPGHTGAFGEPDCGVCHFDTVRDDGAGDVTVQGPGAYVPDGEYEIAVVLAHPAGSAGGFQLTTRFADGEREGGQAGSLASSNPRTRIQRSQAGIEYASHTDAGVSAPGPGPARWTLIWTAPREGGDVAIDVAAQVANDDDSEFGERLYRTRLTIARAAPPTR